ncbi:MAG: cell division protein ZapA [Desulfosarcina sp.]|nr:cell division protein ZapA [Desulfobacterales bacterium]
MEQILTIELFGQSYKFKTKIDKQDAKQVADLLLEHVHKTEKQQSVKSPQINKLAIMIIVALNIANKNVEIQKENVVLLNKISKGYEKLISDLDSVLQ